MAGAGGGTPAGSRGRTSSPNPRALWSATRGGVGSQSLEDRAGSLPLCDFSLLAERPVRRDMRDLQPVHHRTDIQPAAAHKQRQGPAGEKVRETAHGELLV